MRHSELVEELREFGAVSIGLTIAAMTLSAFRYGAVPARLYLPVAGVVLAEYIVLLWWPKRWVMVGLSMGLAAFVEVRTNLSMPGEVLMIIPPLAVGILTTQFDNWLLMLEAALVLLAVTVIGLALTPFAQWGVVFFPSAPWIYMSPEMGMSSVAGLAATIIGLMLLLFAMQRTTAAVSGEIRLELQAQTTDRLTGVRNKTAWTRAGGWKPVSGSLIVVDVDHFGQLNEKLGMKAGDEALKEVAKVLRRNVREGDALYRFGGEEFVIFLRHCAMEVAAERAERLRQMLQKHPMILATNQAVQLTASFGVSSGRAPLDLLFAMADKGVYASKEGGRDRVSVVRFEAARQRAGIRARLLGDTGNIKSQWRVFVASYQPAAPGVQAGRIGEWREESA